jgi:hypothetical protein
MHGNVERAGNKRKCVAVIIRLNIATPLQLGGINTVLERSA